MLLLIEISNIMKALSANVFSVKSTKGPERGSRVRQSPREDDNVDCTSLLAVNDRKRQRTHESNKLENSLGLAH